MDVSPIFLRHLHRFIVNLIYFAKILNLMFIEPAATVIKVLGFGSRIYHAHLLVLFITLVKLGQLMIVLSSVYLILFT